MRSLDPHARDRRAIVAGAIACLAILALGRGLPALRSVERSARLRVEQARTRLEVLESARGVTHEGVGTRSFVILRPTAAEAAAELGRHTTALARYSGLTVESVTPLQASRREDRAARYVTAVSLAASGDTQAVLEFLRELELGAPVVGIASLRLVRQGSTITSNGMRVEVTIRAVAERDSVEVGR